VNQPSSSFADAEAAIAAPPETPQQSGLHGMQPLIRGTLIALYLALVLPLPWLAPDGLRLPLALALPLGALLVLAITSEQVQWDGNGLQVGPAPWCRWLPLRRNWQLEWQSITAIVTVGTSQGGSVYYLKCRDGQAWLLPQRITGFDVFLAQLSRATGLDTSRIGRLTPPWTYQLLAVLCVLMLVAEGAGFWLHQTGQLPNPPI